MMTKTKPQILNTVETPHPKKAAEKFSILLSLEKGFSSKVQKTHGGYLCVASDNRAIFFKKE